MTLAHDVTGDGMPLVLVHGLTFSRRTWDPIVDALSDSFRCIAVDLPGHGDSPGSGRDIQAVTAEVRQVVAEHTDEAPIVVGHSMGVLVATGYAAAAPAAGVVNIDQTMHVGGFAGFVQQLAPALRGDDFESAFAPFEQSIGVQRLPEPERSRVERTRRVSQELVLDYWHLPLTSGAEELQRLVSEMLGQVQAPYLLLSGAAEPPMADEQLLRSTLRTVRVEHWPGAGHVPHLGEPDRFAALLRDFAQLALRTSVS